MNRTPKSKDKKAEQLKDILGDINAKIRVSKMLFEESQKEQEKRAVEELKESKTTDELQEMARTLAKQKSNLERERNKQERMGMSINETMTRDCKKLLT